MRDALQSNCFDHVTSKAETGRPEKASHMASFVTRRRLFIEMTVRRRPPLPVWSLRFPKQTKPWAIPEWWSLKQPWVFKEDFPFQLEDSRFQDHSFWFSSWSVARPSLPPQRRLGHGPVLLTFGSFLIPINAHRIKTWLCVTGRWLFSKCVWGYIHE